MLTCPNGHQVDADAAFCHQCGASLRPPDLTAIAEPLTTVVPLQPEITPPRDRRRRSTQSDTAVYVLAGVIVLIGLIAIGIALLLGSGGGNSSPSAPVTQPTPTSSTPTPSSSATPSTSPSPSTAALPSGGTKCPGTVGGSGTYGTIGSETSCGFAQAVYAAYVAQGGQNVPSGGTRTVSATSPATGKTYRNIVCTSGEPWVTCVGGKNDTAHLFFSRP